MNEALSSATISTTPLLQALHQSFADRGKLSVKGCLRSKSCPCIEVKNLLKEGRPDPQEINSSFYVVMKAYFCFSPDIDGHEHDILRTFSLLATANRFLQLLLEIRKAKCQAESPSTSGDDIQSKSIQLVRAFTTFALSVTVSNDELGDVEEMYSGPISSSDGGRNSCRRIAVFIFGSMLKIDHYAGSNPALLSPLWKGLCEVALHVKGMPSELIGDAVKLLVHHLRNGLESTLDSCQQASCLSPAELTSVLGFRSMLLSFLSTRLVTLLSIPVDPTSVSTTVYTEAMHILALELGLASALENGKDLRSLLKETNHNAAETGFLEPLRQLASRLERSSLSFLSFSVLKPDSLNYRHGRICLDSLLHGDECLFLEDFYLSRPAFSTGATMLLLTILGDFLAHSVDPCLDDETVLETVISICESVVFRYLPATIVNVPLQPSGTLCALLTNAASTVAASLVFCEISLAKTANPKRSNFHHLLLQSLGEPHAHPLAVELFTSTLLLYSIAVAQIWGEHAVTPILRLLPVLLIDERTSEVLRARTSSLVRKMVRSSSIPIRDFLQRELNAEFAKWVECIDTNATSRKRKKSYTGLFRGKGLVLTQFLSAGANPFVTDDDSECLASKNLRSESDVVRAFRSISIALISNQTRPDTWDFIPECVACLPLSRHGVLQDSVGRALLQYVAKTLYRNRFRSTDTQVALICQLLEKTFAPFLSNNSPLNDEALQSLLTGIELMGALGAAVTASSSRKSLGKLPKLFYSLLECTCWPVQTMAMSSLLRFACTVPSNFKVLLPMCLPQDLQTRMQYRLQGRVCCDEDKVASAWTSFRKKLDTMVSLQGSRLRSLKGTELCTISAGSYVLSMPTQAGRRATVIFQPGDTSLEDINMMLQASSAEGDEMPPICVVRRTIPQIDGSCRLLLSANKK